MHGLVTGQESRQQLYTMLTRGRAANHLYLEVVGDGDPHTVIRPETVTPRTPTEFLEQILARDEAPTALRELSEPAARLHQAVQRYTDGLHAAAEQIVGPRMVDALDRRADQVVPGVTDEPAWPTLRTDLIALSAETDKLPTIDPPDPHNSRPLRSNRDNASARAAPMPAPTRPVWMVPGGKPQPGPGKVPSTTIKTTRPISQRSTMGRLHRARAGRGSAPIREVSNRHTR